MTKPYYNEQYKRWIVEQGRMKWQFQSKEKADKFYNNHIGEVNGY